LKRGELTKKVESETGLGKPEKTEAERNGGGERSETKHKKKRRRKEARSPPVGKEEAGPNHKTAEMGREKLRSRRRRSSENPGKLRDRLMKTLGESEENVRSREKRFL